MKKSFLFLLLFCATIGYANIVKLEPVGELTTEFQPYTEASFDRYWNRTTDPTEAVYSRQVTRVDSLYWVVDRYIATGKVQGTGYFRTLENEERVGPFKFYRFNGGLETEGSYVNDQPVGVWKAYAPDGKQFYEEKYPGIPNFKLKDYETFVNPIDENPDYDFSGYAADSLATVSYDSAVVADSVAVVEDIDCGGEDYFENYTEAYFDQNWNRVYEPEEAAYYRRVILMDSLFFAVDYYTSTGTVQGSGCFHTLENEEREGQFRFYYPNGVLEQEGSYRNNLAEGEWRNYDENGNLELISHFLHNELHGEIRIFYPNGKLKRHELFEYGEPTFGVCYDKNGKKKDCVPLYQNVVYPGKEDALEQDLLKNMLKYRPKNLYGSVRVAADIATSGKLENIRILEGDHDLNEAAIKTVSNLRKFKPYLFDGKPTKYKKFTFLLNFH